MKASKSNSEKMTEKLKKGDYPLFSTVKHVPKYSRFLYESLKTPVVMYFIIIGNLFLLSSISIFYYYEQPINENVNTIYDALWWGIATVTTVGYGDIVPITGAGRTIGFFLIILGVIFFVSFSALFVSVLFRLTASEEVSLQKILAEIKELKAEIKDIKEQLKSKE